ncbi:MAG TPA: SufD family Fe-S cluster assembly protein [Clostridiaceae bacterium]|nr:SufD family Fe-S cluster assembly protein [Clostridiaceae bacterium]
MSILKINETPVRTSRNFNINNVKLEDIQIPENLKEFKGTTIVQNNSNIKLSSNIEKYDITYGLGDFFTNQVLEKANKNINIEIDGSDEKNINIDNILSSDNLNLIDNVKILANENSKATIVIKYKSDKNNIESFHNGIIKIIAKNNSNINIIIVNLLSETSNNFLSIDAELEESSKIKATIIDFGGKNSITNYYSNLIGDLSDNKLESIYLGKNNQLIDINYIAELRGKKSNIDINVQGALKDQSKKHFKGTIDFKKGCKKATGNENEECMLLSNKAKSIALPMLLCSEEDVEGNHSSSAGKVGEKELFYIMSRGFNFKEAMKLMVRAKFNKILENIKDENLKQEILDEINTKLD